MTVTAPAKTPFGVEHVKAVCRDIVLPKIKNADDLLWGFRLNGLDLVSSHEYRWPFPGHWAKAPGPFTVSDDPCPSDIGDGICIANTLGGALSGMSRIGSSVGLLVAYLEADVLAVSSAKLRVKRAWVADQFDPIAAIAASRANLYGADLSGADLSRADLSRADLSRADLSGADLSGADLSRANLYGADLSGADLSRADLYGANLYGANLSRACYSQGTLFPVNFDPAAHNMVKY